MKDILCIIGRGYFLLIYKKVFILNSFFDYQHGNTGYE